MRIVSFEENGIHFAFTAEPGKPALLLHCSAMAFDLALLHPGARPFMNMAQVHAAGENQADHHGSKHTGNMPSGRLVYEAHRDEQNGYGRKLTVFQRADAVTVISHYQFYRGIPVVRAWTEVVNGQQEPLGLEYVASFALTGLEKEGLLPWQDKMRIAVPHNTWAYEAQWQRYTLPELGLYPKNDFSLKRIAYSSTGSWPTSEYLPMGYLENTQCGTSLLWQIETNASWSWEISDLDGHLYLQLSSASQQEGHWYKQLGKGESFCSDPVAIAAVPGAMDEAVGALTRYRRVIRRANEDNEALPVIFNDYMNCLMGDPTTQRELPLIRAAAEAGCEYYVIDAGWYSDGPWWDGVGEWLPAPGRFPGGLKALLDEIRRHGMVPGLWLEIEVMGIHCPLAQAVPKDWFFCRHGKPVMDHDRYQLDFRHPDVRAHADAVVDRLVQEYGVGYIKMDYNINAGVGTERSADSFGDGLMGHTRAYLAWLDGVFARYPKLVIENCSSGGMRMDYALLARHSIQSTSDQTRYLAYPSIAAASPTAVTPEQSAVWSYPLADGSVEETVFNMVNAMLLRIHQSGHLANLSPERFAVVREGIAYYKSIRSLIPQGLPLWPLGLPRMGDPWVCFGLKAQGKIFLALWRLSSAGPDITLPFPGLRGRQVQVSCSFPSFSRTRFQWNAAAGSLSVIMDEPNTARLFELSYGESL